MNTSLTFIWVLGNDKNEKHFIQKQSSRIVLILVFKIDHFYHILKMQALFKFATLKHIMIILM